MRERTREKRVEDAERNSANNETRERQEMSLIAPKGMVEIGTIARASASEGMKKPQGLWFVVVAKVPRVFSTCLSIRNRT